MGGKKKGKSHKKSRGAGKSDEAATPVVTKTPVETGVSEMTPGEDTAEAASAAFQDYESQHIANEMLRILRKKNEEINETKDIIINSMRAWAQDLRNKVLYVRAEVNATKEIVLPSCAVLDSLKGKINYFDEIEFLVQNILSKCEYMIHQVPVATNLAEVVEGQVDFLHKKEPTISEIKDLPELLEESSESSIAPLSPVRTLGPSTDPETHSRDLESPDVPIAPLEDLAMEESVEIVKTEENQLDRPEEAKALLIILKRKNENINGPKKMLIDSMKFWVKELLNRTDYVKYEATDARNLVSKTHKVMENMIAGTDERNAIDDYMNTIFSKVEFMMSQVSRATTLIEFALDEITQMEGSSTFRREIFFSQGHGATEGLQLGTRKLQSMHDYHKRSGNELENAVMELYLSDSPERRSRKRDKPGSGPRPRSEEVNRSFPLEDMRSEPTGYEFEVIEIDHYPFENEKEQLSPAKNIKLENMV